MSGNKGCIYRDESSRGLRPNGKVDKRGRWVAEISVDGRLRRMRSADLGRCEEFLKEWQQKAVPKKHVTLEPSDVRYPFVSGRRQTMEQQEARLDAIIREAELTKAYFRTRDFTAISRYVEKTVLPTMSVICRKRYGLASELPEVLLDAVGTLYMFLDADYTIYNYVGFLSDLLRKYKVYGEMMSYKMRPKPIHEAVEKIDISCLATKWNVKPARKAKTR